MHYLYGANPQDNVVFNTKYSYVLNFHAYTQDISVFMENITIVGGYKSCLKVNTDTTYSTKAVCVNCDFIGSTKGNNVSIMSSECYFYNCKSFLAYLDGINYHKKYKNVICKGLEVNCSYGYNGNPNTNSCNGSTIHDGSWIQRYHCTAYKNHGGNFADIGGGTISYNVKCTACNSSGIGIHNSGFSIIISGGCNMYLIDCNSYGNLYDLYKAPSNNILTYKNTRFHSSFLN